MQVSPIISSTISPTSHFSSSMCSSEISANFPQDFSGKLKLDVSDTQTTEKSFDEESFYDSNNHDDDDEKQQQQQQQQHQEEEESKGEDEEVEDDDDDEDEDEEEFEFSFVSTDHDGSPVSADDIFSNGEIRPIFPLFNRDLLFAGEDDGDSKGSSNESTLRSPLRKVFVERRDLPSTSSSSGTNDSEERPVGEYCVWRGKAVEASPEVCKKSNSTGFSRLWRFRDLLHRSSSDGKDAFVFFHESTKPNQTNEKVVKIVKVEKREVSTEKRNTSEVRTNTGRKKAGAGDNAKTKGGKVKTASLSPHEKHYARNRAMKEENRRKSYLPYRQDLVGFFTNVNGLSRNVHPF